MFSYLSRLYACHDIAKKIPFHLFGGNYVFMEFGEPFDWVSQIELFHTLKFFALFEKNFEFEEKYHTPYDLSNSFHNLFLWNVGHGIR